MIEVSGLCKRFGATRAVDEVSITAPSGAVTALLGLNGAGKTTLLRLIADLDRPDAGTVRVSGRDPRRESRPTSLLGVHLGADAMSPRRTTWQHLSWLAALSGTPSSRVEEVLAEVGLHGRRDARIVTLSLGSRQRLAIAAALLTDPAAVILDEPLNGLDVAGIVWLRALLRRLADEGRSVLVASHVLGEIVCTADELVILERGKVAVAGPLNSIVPQGADARDWLECSLLASAS